MKDVLPRKICGCNEQESLGILCDFPYLIYLHIHPLLLLRSHQFI
jgi:hypothetical protein